jgi:hypothetical protein
MSQIAETSMAVRILAGVGAVAIALTLALQLDLMIDGAVAKGLPPAFGVLVFSCFFTMWINVLTAVVLAFAALRPGSTSVLCRPSLKFALAAFAMLSITAFALLLRNTYNFSGPQMLCNVVLHYIVPPLYVLYWAVVVPKGVLRWRDAVIWLAVPIVYFIWVMAQGALTHFYPYPFYQVDELGYAAVLGNSLALCIATLALLLIFVAIDRWLGPISSARTTPSHPGASARRRG